MRKNLWNRMKKLDRRYKTHIGRGLKVAVAWCTTYALILPAITLSQDPICGVDGHAHTESCYLVENTDEEEMEEQMEEQTQEEENADEEEVEEQTREEVENADEEEIEEQSQKEVENTNLAQNLNPPQLEEYIEFAESRTGDNWQMFLENGWGESVGGASYSSGISTYAMRESTATMIGLEELETAEVSETQKASAKQIKFKGGDNKSQDGAVAVSKTIEGTDQENVFDITLKVLTKDVVTEIQKEPDMAVAIVMDISNTMTSDFNGITRYQAAVDSAENFLNQFAQNNLGASRVGFVAFNSDAQEIFPMSQCTDDTISGLINQMQKKTYDIISVENYKSARNRFTNIEAGLKMAADMLDGVGNSHKYIVFLSDGFPTTYIESGYNGYDTYNETNPPREEFYDYVLMKPCWGTSYSNEAAIRARVMAKTIKASGTKIFSIGVDIGGQTIQSYITASEKLNGFSIVDRKDTEYEIGGASDTDAYTKWLTTEIGSGAGYYFDSTDSAGLSQAFDNIFAKIKELNAESAHLDWVATDPMPGLNEQGINGVEFIGFFKRDGSLTVENLVGESGNSWDYENTASFDPTNKSISWDIKKSGYKSVSKDNITNYECQLKYRVRLKNETDGFVEKTDYVTNDRTTLTYRIIEQSGESISVSEQRVIDFQIPKVEGYISELEFNKVSSTGRAVSGAEFTLHHDTTACGYCRGDEMNCVEILDKQAISDEQGKVIFAKIPSGHTYTLTETKVPTGYQKNGNTYQVTVAYDDLSVNVKDSDGNTLDWNQVIENESLYTLPETGGNGTAIFTVAGLLLSVTAGIYFTIRISRKEHGKI